MLAGAGAAATDAEAYLSKLIQPYAPESNPRSGMKSRLKDTKQQSLQEWSSKVPPRNIFLFNTPMLSG